MSTTPAPGAKTRRPGDIPVAEIFAWVVRWKVALAIGVGIVFRLWGYLSGRAFWMDEYSLATNIRTLTPAEFFGPLRSAQLAPPGFLVAVWSMVRLFGDHTYAARLIPLVGGIAGLFLFLAVARRVLPGPAVFPALVMFAVANDPVYYSAELKQYSTDLAATLACLLAALTIGSKPLTAASTALLATGGAVLVWFSHPSIFVLASVGLVGIGRAVRSKDWRWAGLWAIVGAAWLISFAAVHAVATRQLGGGSQGMYLFWDFAFPPMPPRSAWDASWFARHLAYYFINPLNFNAPIGERLSMLPALLLALFGTFRLWKLDRARWALLMLPVALTLLAASLHLYPFHGRLVLFLVPIPLIAVAAGLDAIRDLRGRRVLYYAFAAMVLVAPGVATFQELLDGRPVHNRFGDLHPFDINPYRFPL